MKKLASTLPNMIASLGMITILAGALLGWMYDLTKEPIAQQQQQQQVAAIQKVAPEFNNNPEAEKAEVDINGATYTIYPARMDGKLVGAAVKASSMNGFSGEIIVMVGFNEDDTVRDYQVLQQAETPGLGAKMQMWFRDPAGARSILGKSPANTAFYVSKDTENKGQIDGITAATISSRAFLEAVRGAFDVYKDFVAKDSAK